MNEEGPEICNLTKFVAHSGAASRRAAAELIKNGRVSVDGVVVRTPGLPVGSGAVVALDGVPLGSEPRHYIMLNKPRGYVCTNADRHAVRLAVELIDVDARLYSAGRLDADSEGMLLFSNDGDYVLQLTHPRYEILKEYVVTLNRELTPADFQLIAGGIVDEGERLKPHRIERLDRAVYLFVLNEGKKREIRRLARAVDARVEQLVRRRTGMLDLGDLPSGEWRELTMAEVAASLKNPPTIGRNTTNERKLKSCDVPNVAKRSPMT